MQEQIKQYRKRLGISQRELAKKLHVCQQTIAAWETGSRRVPVSYTHLDVYKRKILSCMTADLFHMYVRICTLRGLREIFVCLMSPA